MDTVARLKAMSIKLRAQVNPEAQSVRDKAMAAKINLMPLEDDIMIKQERATKALLLQRLTSSFESIDQVIADAQNGKATLKDVAYYWTSMKERVIDSLRTRV